VTAGSDEQTPQDLSAGGSDRGNIAGHAAVEPGMTTQPDLYDVVTRGRMFLAAGDPTTAAGMLAQAAALAPTDKAVRTDLARAYFDSAQLSRAEAAFADLVELDPTDVWARRGLARTLRRRSRHAEAAGHDRIADALEV
jgi:Flp pilus assembly protein TadD